MLVKIEEERWLRYKKRFDLKDAELIGIVNRSFNISKTENNELNTEIESTYEFNSETGLITEGENFNDKNWTRKEIAEWASTTPETVIRTLSDFEGEGLIEQKGRTIRILNRAKLLEKSKITF
jgi:CRP-like cAMP-binding protein